MNKMLTILVIYVYYMYRDDILSIQYRERRQESVRAYSHPAESELQRCSQRAAAPTVRSIAFSQRNTFKLRLFVQ